MIPATWIVIVASSFAANEYSPLTAGELLLVYNDADVSSRTLAKHYAELRDVPRDQLCPLVIMRVGEEIAPADFERLIREPVRRYLEEHGLRDKVRCLVTFYGLPIRVGRQTPSVAQQQLLVKWRPRLKREIREFEAMLRQLESVAGLASRPAEVRPPDENDLPRLLQQYVKAREAAIKLMAGPSAQPENEERRRNWLELMQKAEGQAFVATHLQVVSGDGDQAVRRQLERLRESVSADDARVQQILAEGIESSSREEAWQILQRNRGLLALLSAIQRDIQSIQPEETEASVDSELMLLWWRDYPRYRWVVNTLNWQRRAAAEQQVAQYEPPWLWRTLMVSRIDAGSAAVARRMIDQAITIEKVGMTGKFYIDARGLKPDGNYGDYDESLRKLARMLQNAGSIPVVLDNRADVFQPGQCPQAILYCGWYSLRKYVPAFTFVPGAVGFHVGSFEAASLKGPKETGWCKNLLDDGVIATIGPVAEPYLNSFPQADRFFGLLLTGRYTLAECYAYTLPFNSWMQMLLGDPLYRPFARSPVLTVEDVYDPREIPRAFRQRATSQPATDSADNK
ncbi:MAG TPA: TIGR03790 family protein [Phycisphaerae bacterium]|nr:TIGR03790 family protein [Phycisphaerae bacterium]HRR86767.1 TIGR03790 family protein [Phycisphaerae bacterium]